MEKSKAEKMQPGASDQKILLFCPYCGAELSEDSVYCKTCGNKVKQSVSAPDAYVRSNFEHTEVERPQTTQRKTVFDGEVHKCPNCGETLDSFVAHCPSCGYELRGAAATLSVNQLYQELSCATSTEQKTTIIRNYPIPNAKEDIIEFMILASSNISGEDVHEIFEAWVAKFEQTYQKAQITLQNDASFTQIKEIYEKTEKAILVGKLTHTTVSAGNMVTRYFKFMPNPIFAIVVVLLVIFNVIRLVNGTFAAIDIIFDVIILAVAYGITEKGKKIPNKERGSSIIRSGAKVAAPEDKVPMARIPVSVANGTTANYAVVESLFLQAGFTNVKTIALRDLTFGFTKKVGSVDTITIGGKDLSLYFRRKFNANIPVIITYHSMRS